MELLRFDPENVLKSKHIGVPLWFHFYAGQ